MSNEKRFQSAIFPHTPTPIPHPPSLEWRNIKLIISYDGTDFSGWQIQRNGRTVQGELEKALQVIHKKHLQVSGAGRTDAGVHAAAQCANFITDIENIPPHNFVPALNGLLPHDVRIVSAEEVPPHFHARFSAKSRVYRYYIVSGRQAAPHEARYALQLWTKPSLSMLNAYARLLHGETDCSLFASPSDPIFAKGTGSRCRYIHHAYFFIENRQLVFEISANSFFRRMVRSIIGTLLFYEGRETPPEAFKKILLGGKRANAGPTAAPQGLFLWQVGYGGMGNG
ncbi:MAG: tRNA pseudouridine(38-40) synthase TruA [Spirochaetaceae bacterium]|jgi:tRNA pseudouridine38-40 synthase|nr:tRNA pseudouridine(38-40) synthase TruA [Spirochaetaceae bacterium]